MTKNKMTKRSLLMSFLSLLLCIAMLAGTTFAWFTDSVSSKSNRITAGNLDIGFEYRSAKALADARKANEGKPEEEQAEAKWEDVEAIPVDKKDPFFRAADDSKILWEPGAVAYTQFKVVNKGSLALKYNLYTLAKYNYIKDTARSLKDVIKFKVFSGAQEFETRDDIIKAEEADKLALWESLDKFTANGNLEAGESDIFTVVAYWEPGDVDNYYNVKDGTEVTNLYEGVTEEALAIEFDINLRAAQYTLEKDSFDNLYDAKAEYDDGIVLVTDFIKDFEPAVDAAKPTVIQNDSLKVTLPAGACEEGDKLTLKSTLIELGKVDEVTNSQTTTYDIEVLKNGIKVEMTGIEVTVYVGKGFANLTVLHNGVEITEKSYNAETGEVTFITDGFSPYSFIATMPRKVSTAEEIEAALEKGEKVVLTNNVTVDAIINVKNGETAVVDLNGKTLSGTGQRVFNVSAGGNAELFNGTVEGSTYGVVSLGGNVKLTNMNIKAGEKYGVASYRGAFVEMTNCEVISEKWDAVAVNSMAGVKLTGVKIKSYEVGIISNEANNTIEVTDCVINSNCFGVYHNGSYAPVTVTVKNTTINDTVGAGIYISNSVKKDLQTLVVDNCDITAAKSAVEVKHTNATVTNSILTSTCDEQGVTGSTSDTSTWGYAFASSVNGGEEGQGSGTVTLKGNTYNVVAKLSEIFGVESADVTFYYTEPGVTCEGSDFTTAG